MRKHILLTEELSILNGRVKELRSIVSSLTLKEACSAVAYANYEQSYNFETLATNINILFEYAIAHKHPVVFDADVQEKALNVLRRCYEVRCTDIGFLLNDSDIIAGVALVTETCYEVAERFFEQHYTKKGVINV